MPLRNYLPAICVLTLLLSASCRTRTRPPTQTESPAAPTHDDASTRAPMLPTLGAPLPIPPIAIATDSERQAAISALESLLPRIHEANDVSRPAILNALASLWRTTAFYALPIERVGPWRVRIHQLAARGLGAIHDATATQMLTSEVLQSARGAFASDFADAADGLAIAGEFDTLALASVRYSSVVQDLEPQGEIVRTAFVSADPTRSVAALDAVLHQRNAGVEALIRSVVPIPDEIIRWHAAEPMLQTLGEIGTRGALDACTGVLNSVAPDAGERRNALMALGRIAVSDEADRAGIAATLAAIARSPTFDANSIDAVGQALAQTGPGSFVDIAALAARPELNAGPNPLIEVHASIVGALARAARHGDVAAVRSALGRLRADARAARALGADADIGMSLRSAERELAVSAACADGDVACYSRFLASREDTLYKAAYLLAWTVAPADVPRARAALLTRIGTLDIAEAFERRALLEALEPLSPTGCAECATALEAMRASANGERDAPPDAMASSDYRIALARLARRTASRAPL